MRDQSALAKLFLSGITSKGLSTELASKIISLYPQSLDSISLGSAKKIASELQFQESEVLAQLNILVSVITQYDEYLSKFQFHFPKSYILDTYRYALAPKVADEHADHVEQFSSIQKVPRQFLEKKVKEIDSIDFAMSDSDSLAMPYMMFGMSSQSITQGISDTFYRDAILSIKDLLFKSSSKRQVELSVSDNFKIKVSFESNQSPDANLPGTAWTQNILSVVLDYEINPLITHHDRLDLMFLLSSMASQFPAYVLVKLIIRIVVQDILDIKEDIDIKQVIGIYDPFIFNYHELPDLKGNIIVPFSGDRVGDAVVPVIPYPEDLYTWRSRSAVPAGADYLPFEESPAFTSLPPEVVTEKHIKRRLLLASHYEIEGRISYVNIHRKLSLSGELERAGNDRLLRGSLFLLPSLDISNESQRTDHGLSFTSSILSTRLYFVSITTSADFQSHSISPTSYQEALVVRTVVVVPKPGFVLDFILLESSYPAISFSQIDNNSFSFEQPASNVSLILFASSI